jgi:hypothetical protein
MKRMTPKKRMTTEILTKMPTRYLPTRRSSKLKPVRLKEWYPEPQRQLPQKGLPPTLSTQRKGTRRDRNP